MKYGLLPDHLFQREQELGVWKEPEGNEKLLQETISSSYHMESKILSNQVVPIK